MIKKIFFCLYFVWTNVWMVSTPILNPLSLPFPCSLRGQPASLAGNVEWDDLISHTHTQPLDEPLDDPYRISWDNFQFWSRIAYRPRFTTSKDLRNLFPVAKIHNILKKKLYVDITILLTILQKKKMIIWDHFYRQVFFFCKMVLNGSYFFIYGSATKSPLDKSCR